MTAALVSSTLKQSAGTSTSSAIDTTGATALVVAITWYAPNISAFSSLSDSKGNTWTQEADQVPSGGSAATRIYVCENPTVGTNHTITMTCGGQPFYTVVFAAFSGTTQPTSFDKQVSANGTTSTVSPGSVTPTNNNSLVLSNYGTAVSSTGTASTPSGFTLVNQAAYAAGTAIGGGLFYQVQTTATAANPTFTGWSGGSGNTSACSVVLIGTGGGGGGTAYTLTAAQGSFSLTGQAVNFPVARKVTASQGSFSLSGQVVNFPVGRKVVAAQGSFSLNGQAAGKIAARKVTAAQGSFSLTGEAANLNKGKTLGASQGSFVLTGKAVNFKVTRSMVAGTGAFILTGEDANFIAPNQSPWTPANPDSQVWTPAVNDTQAWTPRGSGSTTWTPQ